MNTALRKALTSALGDDSTERQHDDSQARLPLEPASGDGHQRHVPDHRSARTTVAQRDCAVVEPGLSAGDRTPGTAQPEDPDGVAGHLDCTMDELIEPVADASAKPRKTAVGGEPSVWGVGGMRPKRARITSTDR
jgi:hypothetical protein